MMTPRNTSRHSLSLFLLTTALLTGCSTYVNIPGQSDQTVTENLVHPDTTTRIRYGTYVKIGTKVPFYKPFLIDFSVGYGVLNLAGKGSDVSQQHNLLVVDNMPAPEVTVGYIGLGLSVIYKFQ